MAWVNLGAACMQEKKPEGAMECFQKALELNSLDPKLYFNLGSLHSFFFKDNETAIYYYKKAVQYGFKEAQQQVEECQAAIHCKRPDS